MMKRAAVVEAAINCRMTSEPIPNKRRPIRAAAGFSVEALKARLACVLRLMRHNRTKRDRFRRLTK